MRKLPALALALAALLAPAATPADKPNPQQEGAALLARAAEISNMRGDKAKPFRLRAKVTFHGVEAGSIEGSYLLAWSSPTQWRREIVFPGFTETTVGTKEKLWLLRSVDYKPLRVWELDWLLSFVGRLKVYDGERVRKVRERDHDGSKLQCMELKRKNTREREVCLDPDRHVVLYEKEGEIEREYGSYMKLGTRLFPGSMRHVDRRLPLVEVEVMELADLKGADELLFTPPPGAVAWEWCEGMQLAEPLETPNLELPVSLRLSRSRSEVVGYLKIETDGTVSNVTILESSNSDLETAALKAWKQWRYRPAQCNGHAVPTEEIVRTVFRVP